MVVAMSSPVDMFLRMRRQRVHGHSSERPGMHDNAEAEQNSLAQAEERTRCAEDYAAEDYAASRSVARHHILTFKGSRQRCANP